ncbi:MAG: hypothetical protein IJY08_03265 [Clostridia bacterium]|nr:hypothetical protein [Clostridia bacterium]
MTDPLPTVETYGKGFIGIFDGQGHTISNLVINGEKNNGLLGTPYDATNLPELTVKNLALVNASMSRAASITKQPSGFIFGQANGTATFDNIYIQGSIAVTGDAIDGNASNAMGALIGTLNQGMVVNVSNSYFDINTKDSSVIMWRSGAIFGGTVRGGIQMNLTNCALYGDLSNFAGYSYYWSGSGYSQGNGLTAYAPVLTAKNFVVDTVISDTVTTTGLAKGLDFQSGSSDHLTEQDVSGLDAADVEGFTKTVGHLVPTSLLKMFPEHCLEESDVTDSILELEGYQTDNTNKIRLVATIADDNTANYKSVGFEVVAVYGDNAKSTSFSTSTVYTSINANTATGDTAITAQSLIGGNGYIFAMIIGNMPANTPVTFQVKTYYIDANDAQTDGATVVFTVDEIPSGTVSGGK